jgi:uncharacterized protein YjbI with pentapeptide repeats
VKKLKKLSGKQFMDEYNRQIEDRGEAIFKGVDFSCDYFYEGLPGLKNLKFFDSTIMYKSFGFSKHAHKKIIHEPETQEIENDYFTYKLENGIFVPKSPDTIKRKKFENIQFINTTLQDTYFHSADFKNIVFENCNFDNNSFMFRSFFEDMKISKDCNFEHLARFPFFIQCHFKKCDLDNYLINPENKKHYQIFGKQKYERNPNEKPFKDCSFEKTTFGG